MKITLSEQSRRILHWSAWLATAIIALHTLSLIIASLIIGSNASIQVVYKSFCLDQINSATLTILATLLIAGLIVFTLNKFLPVQRLLDSEPDAKGLIRDIISTAIIGVAPIAIAICIACCTIKHDVSDGLFTSFYIDIPLILLMTSIFSPIVLCIMTLIYDSAQKVAKCKQPALVSLAAAGIIIVALVISYVVTIGCFGTIMFHNPKPYGYNIFGIVYDTFTQWILMFDVACAATLVLYVIGRLIITHIAKHGHFSGAYITAQVIYLFATVIFVKQLPLSIASTIAFAGSSVILFFNFIKFKAIKPRNTVYNQLAAALNIITPIFLITLIFLMTPTISTVVSGALVPIMVARLCNRRALQQDSNDQFAKASLMANNCYIALCAITFFVRVYSLIFFVAHY